MLVLTLTPREAVAIVDNLLDPSEFPWNATESQLIALDVRSSIGMLMKERTARDLHQTAQMIPPPDQANNLKKYMMGRKCPQCESEDVGDVGDVNEYGQVVCQNCGHSWEVKASGKAIASTDNEGGG
jgi:Zn ribbon nucleic-acid-binding protein